MISRRARAGLAAPASLLLACSLADLDDLSSRGAASSTGSAVASSSTGGTSAGGQGGVAGSGAGGEGGVASAGGGGGGGSGGCARCAPEEFQRDEDCHCYVIERTVDSWFDARNACELAGSQLAIVTTEEERLWLLSHGVTASWIGADDIIQEGSFVWLDGAPVAHPSPMWQSTEPGGDPIVDDEDCLVLLDIDDDVPDEGLRFHDATCSDQFESVCERDPNE
jgi:hypothetical protein